MLERTNRRLPQTEVSQTEEQRRFKLGFTLAASCLTFIMASLSPIATFFILSGLTTALLSSWRSWVNPLEPINKTPSAQFDPLGIALVSTLICFLSILLYQFNPMAQIVACSLLGASLSAVFIYECIANQQESLNKALHQAIFRGDEDQVDVLLKHGADPFALDAENNTAFHLAVKSNENAVKILQKLELNLRNPISVKSLFICLREYVNEAHLQKWSDWWISLKDFINHYHIPANREALRVCSVELFSINLKTTQKMVNHFAQLLRNNLALPHVFPHDAPQSLLRNANLPSPLHKEILNKILTKIDSNLEEENSPEIDEKFDAEIDNSLKDLDTTLSLSESSNNSPVVSNNNSTTSFSNAPITTHFESQREKLEQDIESQQMQAWVEEVINEGETPKISLGNSPSSPTRL